jgi:hypothetical protein
VNLAAGHQVRQWLNEQALDCALQVARAIPEIRALHQQKVPGAIGDIYQEGFARGSTIYTLLHYNELNINNPAQLLGAQRFLDNDLVQTINEFGRELSARGCDAGARHSRTELPIAIGALRRGNMETQPRTHQRAHFGRAEIAGEEDHGR